MEPEVSVVMSVFNEERYLHESIESILNQTFTNFEFIIIDDGSSDKSISIVESYNDRRIKFLRQNNSGLAIALNNAIRYCRAPFIARMDADDISLPSRLNEQVKFLKNNPDYVLVGSNVLNIDMNGEFVYKSDLPLIWEDILNRFPETSFFHSSVVFKRETFDSSGGYYEEISRFNCFEDSILWNKMKRYGRMANIETALLKYRIRPTSVTVKSGRLAIVRNRVFREIIKDGFLNDINREILSENKLSNSHSDRLHNYHIHLAKKYLWNNYNPFKARHHLFKAINIKWFDPYPCFLLLFTLLPKKFILFFYKRYKYGCIQQ